MHGENMHRKLRGYSKLFCTQSCVSGMSITCTCETVECQSRVENVSCVLGSIQVGQV